MEEKNVIFGKCTEEYGYIMNNVNSEIIFCKKEVLEKIKKGDLIETIENKANLTLNNKKDIQKILEKKSHINENHLSLIRVMLTDVCNANCQYCKVIPNVLNKQNEPVTLESFRYALDLLLKSEYIGPKIIHITGGEPLIFKERVFEILQEIKKKDIRKECTVIIGTNGILLTEELIDEIKKIVPKIKFIISLDGKKDINDAYRKDWNGNSIYEKTTKAIELVKSKNIELGISMVIGSHNINELKENILYVIDQYKPSSLGTNFMKHPTPEQVDYEGLIDPKKYATTLYEVFKLARDRGTYFELVSRKLVPFINKQFRYFDCGASAGSTINIDSRGNIGPCKSMLIMEKDKDEEYKLFKENIEKKWRERTPYKKDICKRCKALSICGNGCAYEAMICDSEIDKRHCSYSNTFMECFIKDLFEISIKHNKGKDIFIPTEEDRKKMIGNCNPIPRTLRWSIGHETEAIKIQ